MTELSPEVVHFLMVGTRTGKLGYLGGVVRPVVRVRPGKVIAAFDIAEG